MRCSRPKCKNGARPGRRLCDRCAERAAIRQECLRAERHFAGACSRCGRPRDDPPHMRCKECRAKARAWWAANAAAPGRRKRRRRRAAARDSQIGCDRRARGACPGCGRRRDDPAFLRCGKCRKKGRDRWARRAVDAAWRAARNAKALLARRRREARERKAG